MATLRVLEVQNEWMLNDSVFLALLHGGGGNKGLLLESNKRGGVQPVLGGPPQHGSYFH